MVRLQSNAWLALVGMAALSAIVGILDLVNGVWYEAQDVTGQSISEIAAASHAGARLADFALRLDGLTNIVLAIVIGAVVVFGFRSAQRWAWWTAWALPGIALGTSVVHVAFGAVGPAASGTVVALVEMAVLLASAPRFFARSGRRE